MHFSPQDHVAGRLPQPFRPIPSRGALDQSEGAGAWAETTSPPRVPWSALPGS